MKNSMLLLFFFCSLCIPMQAEIDPYDSSVMAQLEYLPPWCPPSLFLFDEEPTVIDGYTVNKEVDARGRLIQVTLMRSHDNHVDGCVNATWENGTDRLLRVDVDKRLSHIFVYDEQGRAIKHILEGILTGKNSDEKESYTTFFQFDEQGRTVEMTEDNGRSRRLSYPDNEHSFLVILEKDAHHTFRHAINQDGNITWEIEDTGCTFDIHDLSGISWRKWKKEWRTRDGKDFRIWVEVGGYDAQKGEEILLRTERHGLTGCIGRTDVFDSTGTLISIARPSNNGCTSPMSLEDIRDFVDGILNTVPAAETFLKEPLKNTPGVRPVTVEYTSRGQETSVVYADGTHEETEYSLDGWPVRKSYRDGRRATMVRDAFGHLLQESRWETGASTPTTISYCYEGPHISSWKTSDGIEGILQRDFFGRVTTIDVTTQGVLQTHILDYDALDRLTRVEAQGPEKWVWTRHFSVNGQEVQVEFTKGSQQISMREIRDTDGHSTISKKEGSHEGESSYTSISTSHTDDSRCAFRTTTQLPNQSTYIEERDPAGHLTRRLWQQENGSHILEEKVSRVEENGSTRLLQIAGDKERTIEWTFGKNGHLETTRGAMDNGSRFSYDAKGHLSAKSTSGSKEVRYEWNTQEQMTRLFSPDGTVDYRFFYDDNGRIYKAYDAISHHTVIRTFDAFGHILSDGEKKTTIHASYNFEGELSELSFSDASTLQYHEGTVRRTGTDSQWEKTLTTEAPSCEKKSCPPSKETTGQCSTRRDVTDPLGTWTENFVYDALNQLQREEGEFSLNYGFDAFGDAQTEDSKTYRYNQDGDLISTGTEAYQYDALGRLISAKTDNHEEQYRYDGFGRLQEISTNDGARTRLCWLGDVEVGAFRDGKIAELKIPHPLSFQPIAIEIEGTPYRVHCDARGSIIALYDVASEAATEVYRYGSFGQIHIYDGSTRTIKNEALSPWLYCGKRWLAGSQAYDFGTRRYFPHCMRWAERDPLGLVDTVDDRLYARNNPNLFTDPTGLFPCFIDWSKIGNSMSHAIQTISHNTHTSITFAKQRLDWILEFRSTYEDLIFKVLGRTWLRLVGYNLDWSTSETYGGKENQKKVRITLINGILNGMPEARRSAGVLSSTHGDIPVHFVYSATGGFAHDIFRGTLSKAGIISRQATMLVDLWRDLIDEMGGTDGGGTILHYAHSLGATDTLNALHLLTPEERKCIRVATFGSPTLIDDGACGKVDNYISLKDGVPIIDYLRYYDGLHGKQANVHFIPSDSSIPFADHLFDGKTYRSMLEMLGHLAQEEFLRSQ